MGDEFNEMSEVDDTVEIENEVDDTVDFESEIDEALDQMSLDELRDLREFLNENLDGSDNYDGIEELEDLGKEDKEPDYSYHFDGGPTHNVEWDDNDENPNVRIKVLTKTRKR